MKDELENMLSELNKEMEDHMQHHKNIKVDLQKYIKIAKETGEPQFYKEYIDHCSDPNEECNFDIVKEYVDQNGNVSKTRTHTY